MTSNVTSIAVSVDGFVQPAMDRSIIVPAANSTEKTSGNLRMFDETDAVTVVAVHPVLQVRV